MRIHVLTEALYGEKTEGDEAKNKNQEIAKTSDKR